MGTSITIRRGGAHNDVIVNDSGKLKVIEMGDLDNGGRDKVRRMITEWFRQQREIKWRCPIGLNGCTKNCGSYGCGN